MISSENSVVIQQTDLLKNKLPTRAAKITIFQRM